MKCLFYLAKAYSIPVVMPIVNILERNVDHSYRFYVSDRIKEVWPDSWRIDYQVNKLNEVIAYQPDFVICPGNYVDHRFPGYKVQIFHGVGVEKSSHFEIRDFFDLYLTSGPLVTDRFNQLAKKHGFFKVIETGWPKFDHIINYTRHYDLPDLQIDKDKKVMLYAPTFSRRMHSAADLLPILRKIIKDDEVWVIKFHELMDNKYLDELHELNKSSVIIATDNDITPYLYLADIMISDTSSVVYEFLALDKPVITYRTHKYEQKAINIFNPDELRPSIDILKSEPEIHLSQSKAFLNQVNPYLDGCISENIVSKLEKVLREGLQLKEKPWNLIRKFKVLYHYYFKKGYLE